MKPEIDCQCSANNLIKQGCRCGAFVAEVMARSDTKPIRPLFAVNYYVFINHLSEILIDGKGGWWDYLPPDAYGFSPLKNLDLESLDSKILDGTIILHPEVSGKGHEEVLKVLGVAPVKLENLRQWADNQRKGESYDFKKCFRKLDGL